MHSPASRAPTEAGFCQEDPGQNHSGCVKEKEGEQRSQYDHRKAGPFLPVDGLGRLGSFPPHLLCRLPGKGALRHGCLRPESGLHGLVPLRPGLLQIFPHGFQIDNGAPEPADGIHFGNPVCLQPLPQEGELLLGCFRGGFCVRQSLSLALLLQASQAASSSCRICARAERVPPAAGGGQLGFQGLQLGELPLCVLQLCLDPGDHSAFVVAAAGELLFQCLPGFCIRGVLLAGEINEAIRRSRPASGNSRPLCRMNALRSNTSRLTPRSVSPQV